MNDAEKLSHAIEAAADPDFDGSREFPSSVAALSHIERTAPVAYLFGLNAATLESLRECATAFNHHGFAAVLICIHDRREGLI